MKPNPEPILTAASGLGVAPAACVLVGDSTTDVEASRAAGVCSIGYANKPGKVERLERAGADAIVTSMADIATALLHHAGSS
jgi:beta-phosphoglucomutase-like phosphatase (HAD superfamily)